MILNDKLYTIKWLGYNELPNYNRIWGIVELNTKRNFAFWGVKDKKISFKYHKYIMELNSLIITMERKGYKKISPLHYELISPGFNENFEQWLMAAILSDDF